MKRICFALISSLILCCGFAHATVDISFSLPSLTETPEDVLTFIRTLDRSANLDLFLDEDSLTLMGSDFRAIEGRAFFAHTLTGFPHPHRRAGNIGRFNIDISNDLTPGADDEAFQIQLCAGLGDPTVIGSANLKAPAAVSAVPEPGSIVLLLSVLIGVAIVCKRTRVRASE